MLAMAALNPELARSTPADSMPGTSTRPGSVYNPLGSRGSISNRHSFYGTNPEAAAEEIAEDDEVSAGMDFTYIPPNPKKYYKKLLEMCLVADLEIMLSPETEETDEVSLGILSAPHLELLNECAMRWRIGHPYRASAFLDLVRQFYERGEIPMECIPEALQNVSRVMQDTDISNWSIQDVRFLWFFNISAALLTTTYNLVGLSGQHLWRPLQHFLSIAISYHGVITEPQEVRSGTVPARA